MTYIDTREFLTELRDLCGGDELNPDPDAIAALDDKDRERINAINALLDETGRANTVEGRNSWGITLIPEEDFEDYAREFADEIGAIDANASWPMDHIDWPAAANALRLDYDEVDFDGTTYLYRA